MKRKRIHVPGTLQCVAALTLVALAGCQATTPGLGYVGGWDRNITDEGARWIGYEQDRIYELNTDVFLVEIPDRTNGPALVAGMETPVPPGTVRGPTATTDYLQRPRDWRWVQGIVVSGTRVRATRLRSKGNLRTPRLTRDYVKGDLMDGPYRGKRVDLEPLSLYVTDEETGRATLTGPNEDLLRRVF